MLRRLALAAALAAAGPAAADLVDRTARVVWSEAWPGFGSFSGLHVSADGQRCVTVSDKGAFAAGRFLRDGGRLTGVTPLRHGPLRAPDGTPLSGRRIDAEGLTAGPDGRLYVSFEAVDRIAVYDDIALPPVHLPSPAVFATLQNNSALEALASDTVGRLYAIPERSGALDRPFPIYRFDGGGWDQPFAVPRRPPYLVTGAEIGPDGRLYVLERDYSFLGFRTRIRRFAIGAAGLSGEETVVETGFGRFDNLEGIALWQDAAGRIRILCISDDNARIFQRTEFVEFTLAAD